MRVLTIRYLNAPAGSAESGLRPSVDLQTRASGLGWAGIDSISARGAVLSTSHRAGKSWMS
jgi:hypothetical protein